MGKGRLRGDDLWGPQEKEGGLQLVIYCCTTGGAEDLDLGEERKKEGECGNLKYIDLKKYQGPFLFVFLIGYFLVICMQIYLLLTQRSLMHLLNSSRVI